MCATCGCEGDGEPALTAMGAEPGHQAETSPRERREPHVLAHGAHEHEHPPSHHASTAHEHAPHGAPGQGHARHGDHDGHAHTHGHAHVGLDAATSAREEAEARSGRMLHLEQQVLARNNQLAERNRGFFAGRGVLALNVLGGPGAGKTTLLERTLETLRRQRPVAVIEGDQATLLDAERIRAAGAPVVQVNTGSGCHLDAQMVADSVEQLDPEPGSLLLIENVGNLVCPALFDLGEAAKVVVLSVTEGEDKPLKYPHIFRASELMLLNKVDLLPYTPFDVERCIGFARQIQPRLQVLQVSTGRGDGLEAWFTWLRERSG